MPPRVSTAVSQNTALRPASWVTAGPSTRARAKVNPMLVPMMAMALVRCSSRVRSAHRASTAADTAPRPCRARPRITSVMVSASAASTLPAAKMASPARITRLRPMRSESMPKGTCTAAWVRP